MHCAYIVCRICPSHAHRRGFRPTSIVSRAVSDSLPVENAFTGVLTPVSLQQQLTEPRPCGQADLASVVCLVAGAACRHCCHAGSSSPIKRLATCSSPWQSFVGCGRSCVNCRLVDRISQVHLRLSKYRCSHLSCACLSCSGTSVLTQDACAAGWQLDHRHRGQEEGLGMPLCLQSLICHAPCQQLCYMLRKLLNMCYCTIGRRYLVCSSCCNSIWCQILHCHGG